MEKIIEDIKKTISLAVMPFDNLTGKVEKDYFSRGFVEDLIIDLSRFSNLHIISSQTTLSVQILIEDEKKTAESLGIDFILKGNLRHLGNKLRINTQLVDPLHNHVLWAERYDAADEKIFEIQDGIVEQVVGALSVKIDTSILAAARNKPTTQLEAYDCWLRGFEYLRQGTLKDDEMARDIFKRALEIDPHYGRAYAGLSLSYFNEWSCQLWERWEDNQKLAYENALLASQYDQSDHIIQMVLGRVLIYRGEYDQAIKHLDRALELNPNDADNLVQMTGSKALLGEGEEGIRLFDKALRLNPYHGDWYYVFGALPYFVEKRYKEMIKITKKVNPTISVDLSAFLAAAYAYLGDLKQAEYYKYIYFKTFQEKITYGRPPEPGEPAQWATHINSFRNPEDVHHFEQGLRLAGIDGPGAGPEASRNSSSHIESIPSVNTFRKIDQLWELRFDNKVVQLTEVKGFIDLKCLLSRPGENVHCSELMGTPITYNDGEEVIDEQAKKAYQKRIVDLQEDLDEAETMNDLGRISILRNEMDQLIDFLSKSIGFSGRTRKIGSSSEKARTAVTWRIRSAIQKIEKVHPSLAKHLSNTIQTGTYFMYSPEKEQIWQV